MLLRQKPDTLYNYPEHVKGLKGFVRRTMYFLGFDPLTVYERLDMVTKERDWYKEQIPDPVRLMEA